MSDRSYTPLSLNFQPDKIIHALDQPEIYDRVFSMLSPVARFNFSQSCKVVNYSNVDFERRAFNINTALKRFFANPLAFRSLQARTGSLISGSFALQFLNRTCYEGSDLDLYVHSGHTEEVGLWLMQQGYAWLNRHSKPGRSQPTADPEEFKRRVSEVDPSWGAPPGIGIGNGRETRKRDHVSKKYHTTGILEVFTFMDGGKKIDVIVSKKNPLDCVLQFHSSECSCVDILHRG